MHLVIIVGDHGADHWRVFPVVARRDDLVILFLDYRMGVAERVRAYRETVPLSRVTSYERIEVGTPPVDCAADIHDWQPVGEGQFTVAGRCSACGEVEMVPDPPAGLRLDLAGGGRYRKLAFAEGGDGTN